MTAVEVYWKALDSAIWELGEAFKDFPSEDLWERPHPNLLSVGEIAMHITYWEAQSFLGAEGSSPLVQEVARYYPHQRDAETVLELSPESVYLEIQRVHLACKTAFHSGSFSLEENCPYREGWNWQGVLEYQCFHIAYHTGQIYSVRHLLGHTTVDN